jgi:hypothetical protein
VAGSDVDPRVPVPVGVGIFIAGGNNNNISGNRIYDNWRRGSMLIHVPDSLSDEKKTTVNSTSHRNRYHDNVMGIAPNGSKLRTAWTSGGTRRRTSRTTAGTTTVRSRPTRRPR